MLARKIISIILAVLILGASVYIIWNAQKTFTNTTDFSANYQDFLDKDKSYNKIMSAFQEEFTTVQQAENFTVDEVEGLQQGLKTLKTSSQELIAVTNTMTSNACLHDKKAITDACIANFKSYKDVINFYNDFLDFTIDTYTKRDTINSQAVQANINKKVKLLNEKGKTYETAHTAFVTLVKGKKGFEEVQ